MSWQKWVLVALFAVNVLATIMVIGKPRKPISPGMAVSTVVVQSALIALVVTA